MIAQVATNPLQFNTLIAAANHFFRGSGNIKNLLEFHKEWKLLSESDKIEVMELLIEEGYIIGNSIPIKSEGPGTSLIVIEEPKATLPSLSAPPVDAADDESLHASNPDGYSVGEEHPAVKAA